MEQKIEGFVDRMLENFAPQFFWLSVILGVIIILLGITFTVRRSSTKNLQTVGMICIGVGVLAILSGWVQM
ncbi:hypothetical protein [Paenibacillus guangzhouensis]|uniref:hypothetical protein n=1 Tax=Paenibacillus guangzhouensis TaxID=1473112 RepID=UPI0012676CE9|nr:hypothetical protein [Paenibacillus guangzhouensis]